MSEWFYIRVAYGLTWVVVAGYTWLVMRRLRAAEIALREQGGGEG